MSQDKSVDKNFLYVRMLPASVKAAFKSECARNGRSMRVVIEALMRLYMDPKSRGEFTTALSKYMDKAEADGTD
jgi:hypothetical protein